MSCKSASTSVESNELTKLLEEWVNTVHDLTRSFIWINEVHDLTKCSI